MRGVVTWQTCFKVGEGHPTDVPGDLERSCSSFEKIEWAELETALSIVSARETSEVRFLRLTNVGEGSREV